MGVFAEENDERLWNDLLARRDGYIGRRLFFGKVWMLAFAAMAVAGIGGAIFIGADGGHAGAVVMTLLSGLFFAGMVWLIRNETNKKASTMLLRDYAQNAGVLASWDITSVKSGAGVGPVAVHPLRMVFVNLYGVDKSHEQFRIPGRMADDAYRLLTELSARRG